MQDTQQITQSNCKTNSQKEAFSALLDRIRIKCTTQREKGTSFETLTQFFLENDSTYKNRFSKVQFYAQWAKEKKISAKDTGIDLVATLRDDLGGGTCAIQCKLYQENHKITKSDIDTFFTASGKKYFTERIIADSTRLL